MSTIQGGPRDVVTQAQAESRLIALDLALADTTAEYRDLAEHAATVEADYKRDEAYAIIRIAARGEPPANRGGPTAAEKEAEALALTEESHRAHLLAQARLDTCKQALLSLRAQISAVQTLCSNIRAAGG